MNNKFPIFVGLENDQLTEDAAFSAALTCIYLSVIRCNKQLPNIKKEDFNNLIEKDNIEIYFVPKNWDGIASKYYPSYQEDSILINVITPGSTSVIIGNHQSILESTIANSLPFLNNFANKKMQVFITIARNNQQNINYINELNSTEIIAKIAMAAQDSRLKFLKRSFNKNIRLKSKIKGYKFFIGQMHILMLDLLNSK